MKQFVSNRGGPIPARDDLIQYWIFARHVYWYDTIPNDTSSSLPFFKGKFKSVHSAKKHTTAFENNLSDGSDVPGTYCNYGRWKEFCSRQRRGSSWWSMIFCCWKYCYFSTVTSTPKILCYIEAWMRRSNSFHKGLSVMGQLYYYQQSPLG